MAVKAIASTMATTARRPAGIVPLTRGGANGGGKMVMSTMAPIPHVPTVRAVGTAIAPRPAGVEGGASRPMLRYVTAPWAGGGGGGGIAAQNGSPFAANATMPAFVPAGFVPFRMYQFPTPAGSEITATAIGPAYGGPSTGGGYGDAIETNDATVTTPTTAEMFMQSIPIVGGLVDILSNPVIQVEKLENELAQARASGASQYTINNIEAKLAGARHKLEVQLASEQHRSDLYNIGKIAGLAVTGVAVAGMFAIIVRALRS